MACKANGYRPVSILFTQYNVPFHRKIKIPGGQLSNDAGSYFTRWDHPPLEEEYHVRIRLCCILGSPQSLNLVPMFWSFPWKLRLYDTDILRPPNVKIDIRYWGSGLKSIGISLDDPL